MSSVLAGPLINAIVTWLAGVIIGSLNVLWDLLSATAFTTPDVTVLTEVNSFAAASLAVVNTAYVLAILWVAILVLARDTIQTRYGLGELVPRLVIGLVGANLAMPLCSQLIEGANAVTAALTSQGLTAPGAMREVHDLVTASLAAPAGTDPQAFLLLVIGLVIAVMVGMLLVQWIVRLGILIVAVGVAPIALALHGTPHTEPVAKLWWRTMLGALATVLIQAIALHTTLTVFLGPHSDLPALGFEGNPGAVMKLLVVLCLLWAMVKVPAMMRRYVSGSSPSRFGAIVRVVLVQQLTRGVGRVVAGAGAARGGARNGRRGPAVGGEGPWSATPSRNGGRLLPPPGADEGPAARTSRPARARASGLARVSSRKLAGAGPGVVGTAYPSGRPVKPYTPEEIAGGVDVYTRSLRRRAATPATNRRIPPTGRTR